MEAPPHPPPGAARADVVTTEFSTARMEETRFDALWLRVGPDAANLYCHQGGCEHLLSFQVCRGSGGGEGGGGGAGGAGAQGRS